MAKHLLYAFFFLGALANGAFAEEATREGRSASCSTVMLVCAVMNDGTVKPTNECDARAAGAAKVLSGDCYDED